MKERGRGSTYVLSEHNKTHVTSHSRENKDPYLKNIVSKLALKNRTELRSYLNIPIILYP